MNIISQKNAKEILMMIENESIDEKNFSDDFKKSLKEGDLNDGDMAELLAYLSKRIDHESHDNTREHLLDMFKKLAGKSKEEYEKEIEIKADKMNEEYAKEMMDNLGEEPEKEYYQESSHIEGGKF